MSGVVFLVGAGPGAPDLLTLRAARLLERADIVFHDALVHADTLAIAARAVKIAVGKRCGRRSTAQKFINKRLIDAAGPMRSLCVSRAAIRCCSAARRRRLPRSRPPRSVSKSFPA